jgi:OmpA-OmpF porin, OOP family
MRCLFNTKRLWAIALLIVCTLAGVQAHAQASGNAELDAFTAALAKAHADQVDVLSPKGFAKATEIAADAAKDVQNKKAAQKIQARVAEGIATLDAATRAAATTKTLLTSIVQARADALAAEAPKYAAESWAKADARFAEAAGESERNDPKTAVKRAAEAEVLLRDCELLAIKGKLLGAARGLIAKADEQKVEKVAPRTLGAAHKYLADAEQEITHNRYDTVVPQKLAGQARYEAAHALYLAQLIAGAQQMESDKKAGFEDMVLSWEGPLVKIANELDVPVSFDQGYLRPMDDILAKVQKQQAETRRLTQELSDRNAEVTGLKSEVDRLEKRLGGVSEERTVLQKRVDLQDQLRASVATVESSFDANAGRVYRQGDDIVVSLTGINFASGRSTIDPASLPLLHRVQDAILRFQDASVVVEGHTDSSGNASANLILSQDRADAVKQYLLTNKDLNPEKVSSVGYGETRPVSSNDTAEGRARNRRIDVVIRPGGQ